MRHSPHAPSRTLGEAPTRACPNAGSVAAPRACSNAHTSSSDPAPGRARPASTRRAAAAAVMLVLAAITAAAPPAPAGTIAPAAARPYAAPRRDTDSAGRLSLQADTAARRETRAALLTALPLLFDASARFAATGRPDSAGRALRRAANAYDRLGERDSAIATLGRALSLARAHDDPAGLAAAQADLGLQLMAAAKPDSARRLFHQALEFARTRRDLRGAATAMTRLGALYVQRSSYDSATAYLADALTTALTGAPPVDSATLGAIYQARGELHRLLGRADSAMADHRRALAIWRASGNQRNAAASLNAIAVVFVRGGGFGRPDSGFRYYHEALAIRRALGTHEEGQTLMNIGVLHWRLGGTDSAMHYFRAALPPLRARDDLPTLARTFNNIANIHADEARLDSALAGYREALSIHRATGNALEVARVLANIGRAHLAPRPPTPLDARTATVYLDSAASVIDTIRGRAGSETNAIAFADEAISIHSDWAKAWRARDRELGADRSARAALAVIERARARVLLSRLSTPPSGAAQPELLKPPASHAPGEDLLAEADALLAPLARAHVAALIYWTALDSTFVWYVAPDGAIQVTAHPTGSNALDALVQRARTGILAAVAGPGGGPVASDPLGRLAALLLPDAIGALPPGTDVLILPHGPLAQLPFGALPLPGGEAPLGIRHALRIEPSIAALAALEARRAPVTPPAAPPAALPSARPTTNRTLDRRPSARRRGQLAGALIFGNPVMPPPRDGEPLTPLPATEREALDLAALVGTTALTGQRASESAAWARLATSPLIHFATHARAYGTAARVGDSFIALAPDSAHDGLLTADELLNHPTLTLSADLVVLSACETGIGQIRSAEGVVGLARAFLARGARSVLMSLWDVDDAATAYLMRRYYAHWLDDRDLPGKHEALRRAQADMRAVPAFAAPRYWAAFQIVGAR